MLKITEADINGIFGDYGIPGRCRSFDELQRYDYEDCEPAGKYVRLIVKAETEDGRSFVLRFKNEDDVTPDIVEAQSRFAAALRERGIETPRAYASEGRYARVYRIGGYEVIVTAEEFVTGEISTVDEKTAERTGMLLARMHNIAEEADLHVENEVLFDPLTYNDLFDHEKFSRYETLLKEIDAELYDNIEKEYARLEGAVRRALEAEPRYAVQGDISDCNLYDAKNGELGVFDFNRSGDNALFADAAMQAVFEARLMDYPPEIASDPEPVILPAFLRGYGSVRPFTREQRALFPDLYALISAFWLVDLRWCGESLENAVSSGDAEAVHGHMKKVFERLTAPAPDAMP